MLAICGSVFALLLVILWLMWLSGYLHKPCPKCGSMFVKIRSTYNKEKDVIDKYHLSLDKQDGCRGAWTEPVYKKDKKRQFQDMEAQLQEMEEMIDRLRRAGT